MDGLKRHGTDWAYARCTSGPGGGKCEVCRSGRQERRNVRLLPPAPTTPELERLRREVACLGCGAVRVPCAASRQEARTRIDHKPGCPVADISENDEEEVAA